MLLFTVFDSLHFCLLQNKIAAVIIAGVTVGAGYFLCIDAKATAVGFDTVALLLHSRHPKINVAVTMFIINVAVLSLGFFVYGISSVIFGLIFSGIQALSLNTLTRLLSEENREARKSAK